MPPRNLKFHAFRLAAGTALLVLLGLLSGQWAAVIAIGVLGYLGWGVYNATRLYRWLDDDQAEPPESLGMWSDIFDRIHALQARNRKQQRRYESAISEFQSMTDAFPDATLVLDDADNITWFNGAAAQLLGLRVPEDMGQPVTNLLRGPDFANWLSVQDQVDSRMEMNSPLDPTVRLSLNAVRYQQGQRLLILRDVTDVHNLERVRRDFVANVSHELRTPLTVLLGYLEALQEQCPEEMGMPVERMQEQARQMQALLNDLLELSRLQTDRPDRKAQSVDVPAMLTQLREQAEALSQGHHAIKFTIDENVFLLGVQTDLESAFRNLITNAVHYTPSGGSIRVKWGVDDGAVRLAVSDTGIGIPRRDLQRVTERFYRVGSDRSRHRGGTGLGLAIVKHVMNAHGARLAIESELGEGSTFTCIFPTERLLGREARSA